VANARVYVLLSVLTVAAGYSDAVSFFGLGVFTANMTGNTVLLAGALASRFVPHVAGGFSIELTALSLACFTAGGGFVAFVLRGEAGRPPVRTIAVMCLVTVLLVGAALLFTRNADAHLTPVCVALLSLVAGMQAVVAARAGVPGITTIVVTGAMVTALIDFFGSTPGADRRKAGVPYGLEWLLYLGGGGLGTLGLGVLGNHALWPAAAVVALLIPVL
jgi:uncharacterized membrane protein YoaK (UPF0700 family)